MRSHKSRDRITIYIDTDGLVTVRMPLGVMPDRETIRSVVAAINAERRYHNDCDEMGSGRCHRGADDYSFGDTGSVP